MYCRNLLCNSSFEEDLEFWNYTTLPTIETDCPFHGNKCASITCTDTTSWHYFASIPFRITQGHKYYFGGFVRGTGALHAGLVLYDLSRSLPWDSTRPDVDTSWQLYSKIVIGPTGWTHAQALMYSDLGTAQGKSNKIFYDALFLVDLTEAFGAGNEPAVSWCDTHIFYEGDQCRILSENEAFFNLIFELGMPLTFKVLDTVKLSDGSACITNVVAFWQPVYDRVPADCVYGNPKGCFDSKVFNRIEYNMRYLAYIVEQQGYNPIHYDHDAVRRDFYLLTDTWNRLKQSTLNCKEFYVDSISFPPVSLSEPCELVDYIQINNVEYMQWLLYQHLTRLVADAYCVNDMYVGDYLIGGIGT